MDTGAWPGTVVGRVPVCFNFVEVARFEERSTSPRFSVSGQFVVLSGLSNL